MKEEVLDLIHLPPEILSRIFVESSNFEFRLACRWILDVTSPKSILADFVLKLKTPDRVFDGVLQAGVRRLLIPDAVACLLARRRAVVTFDSFLMAVETDKMLNFVAMILNDVTSSAQRLRFSPDYAEHFSDFMALLSSGLFKATRSNALKMVNLFLNILMPSKLLEQRVPTESDSESDGMTVTQEILVKVDITDSIHNCCRLGHSECLKLLLEANVKAEAWIKARPRRVPSHPLFTHGKDCLTLALRNAAARNHASCITLLIQHGANPNETSGQLGTNDDASPLSHASFRGHIEAVTALLDAGANGVRAGGFALLLAVSQSHVGVVRLLAERLGKQVLEFDDHRALKVASMQKSSLMVDTLLKLGANADHVVEELLFCHAYTAAQFLLSRHARI